jgi:hypothetical protein
MGESTQITIGINARCSDGVCGTVIRVVVDSVARVVTHIVVEPKHREGFGRLVPLDLVDTRADEVMLGCTTEQFEKLEMAEETRFLPNDPSYPGYASGEVFAVPLLGMGAPNVPPPVTTDALPLGEVGVRRDEQVHATDGEIGRVRGVVMDTASRRLTHVLLKEGHLWGRKQVAIPIAAVTGIEFGIRLNMTKQEVQDLPPVAVDAD